MSGRDRPASAEGLATDALKEALLNLEIVEADLSRVKARLNEWIERLEPSPSPQGALPD